MLGSQLVGCEGAQSETWMVEMSSEGMLSPNGVLPAGIGNCVSRFEDVREGLSECYPRVTEKKTGDKI
jgi:hypothetical protein